jgi:hypothetical protein
MSNNNRNLALYDMKNNILDILSIISFKNNNIKFNPYRDVMNVEIYHGLVTKFTDKARRYIADNNIVIDYNYLCNQIIEADEHTVITLEHCEHMVKISMAKIKKILKYILNNLEEF